MSFPEIIYSLKFVNDNIFDDGIFHSRNSNLIETVFHKLFDAILALDEFDKGSHFVLYLLVDIKFDLIVYFYIFYLIVIVGEVEIFISRLKLISYEKIF